MEAHKPDLETAGGDSRTGEEAAVGLAGAARPGRSARSAAIWVGALAVAILLPDAVERVTRKALQERISRAFATPSTIEQVRLSLWPVGLALDRVRSGSRMGSERVLLQPGVGGSRLLRLRKVTLIRPVLRIGHTTAPPSTARQGASSREPDTQRLRSVLATLARHVELEVREGAVVARRSFQGHEARLRLAKVFLRRSGDRYRLVATPGWFDWGGSARARIETLSIDVDPASWKPVRFAALAGLLYLPAAAGTRLRLRAVRGRFAADGSVQVTGQIGALAGGAGHATVDVTTSAELDRLAIELELAQFPFRPLASLVAPLGLDPMAARADGTLTAHRSGAIWRLRGALELKRVIVLHPFVARRGIGPFDSQVRVDLRLDTKRGELTVAELHVDQGDLKLRITGKASIGASRRYLSAKVDVPPLQCQHVLRSLPAGFAPKLRGLALRGKVGLESRIDLEGGKLDQGIVEVSLDPMSCRVRVDPPLADVRQLNEDMSFRVRGPTGEPMDWHLGSSNPYYRPLSRISAHVRDAFVVSEDARFFAHRGFDPAQLRRAFLFDLQAGRIARGASTISQQVVKNAFLSHDRTLARKFQEAVLTWRLEQVVPKRRILQSYLNLVELGPGIYGVQQAAERYFNRSAATVTPLQAVHLAALTPNPRPLSRRFAQDPPGPAWMERLRLALRSLRRGGKLDVAAERRWARSELGLVPYALTKP